METTWAHELRSAGLRVTRPRLSVLSVLSEHPHADADTIVTGARDLHPSLSPQAVYGVLKALVAGGLARRIEPAGAPALFELAGRRQPSPPRLPLVRRGRRCRLRRRGGPLSEPSDAAGFVVDEAEVVFWGLCSNCQNHEHEIRGGAIA